MSGVFGASRKRRRWCRCRVIKSHSPCSFTLDNLYDELRLSWPSLGCSHTLLMMLSGPFLSWTSLTSSLSSNHSETWIRLAPTSLALQLPSLLHQHLPDRVPRRPTSPSPPHPLPPPLTLPPLLQVALFASFTPLLVMLRPNASSNSKSFVVSTLLLIPQLPLPPHRLSHLQTPHSPPQLHQQVPFLLPHSSMTLTPPGMQTLAPQLI